MKTKLGGLTQKVKEKSYVNFYLPERFPSCFMVNPYFDAISPPPPFFPLCSWGMQNCVQILTQISLYLISSFGASLLLENIKKEINLVLKKKTKFFFFFPFLNASGA